MRDEQIQSAVSFLREPQVAAAPMSKKLEFLESKGLTSKEIQEALSLVDSGAEAAPTQSKPAVPSAQSVPSSFAPRPSYMTQQPPPIPQRDWKEYFVMATVSVGVAYGVYELAKRYWLPMIMPPTPPALEQDKAALEAEFERIEQLLQQVEQDTAELRDQEKSRADEFRRTMEKWDRVMQEFESHDEDRKQESRLALSNIESLRSMLPEALKQHSETQAQAVVELQNELKSLKQLVARRQPNAGPQIPPASAVPTTLPGYARKPKKPDSEGEASSFTSTTSAPNSAPNSAPGSAPSSVPGSAPGSVPGSAPSSAPASASTSAPGSAPTSAPESQTPDTESADKESKQFLPDPKAGIPDWQRTAG